ncbi:MAG TPA: hypothetical protein VF889_02020 [Bacteroidota bacterium]
MEQRFADQIAETLAKRLPAGSKLRMGEALAAQLPASVRAWMAGVVAGWIAKQLEPDLSQAAERGPNRRITHALVRSRVPEYRIGRDYLLRLLHEATAFVEAYLRRPRSVLEGLLLAGGERVSVPEIASRLDMITEYRYLGMLSLRLLRGRTEVERPELRRLIARVDEEVVRTHGPEELTRLMAPLFSWYALAGLEGVPREAVRDFLDDKRMGVLRDYVEGVAKIGEEETLTAEEISTLAGEVMSTGGTAGPVSPWPTPPGGEEAVSDLMQEASKEPEQEESREAGGAEKSKGAEETLRVGAGSPTYEGPPAEKNAAEAEQATGAAEGGVSDVRPSEDRGSQAEASETIPLWLQGFSPQAAPPQVPTSPSQPPGRDESGEPRSIKQDETGEPLPSPRKPRGSASTNSAHESFKENVRRNFALSLTSAGFREVGPAKPPLASVFSESQRAALTTTLFQNDAALFNSTVEALAGLPGWRAATRYLTEFLETHRLNPYAKDVMEFTGAVRQWFVGKEERP